MTRNAWKGLFDYYALWFLIVGTLGRLNYVASIQSKVACENNMIHIKCPHKSLFLSVNRAVYGRELSRENLCPSQDRTIKDCGISVVTDRVKKRCDGQTECSFTANNRNLGSFCTNVYKYLLVIYECAPRPTTLEPPTTTRPPTQSTTTHPSTTATTTTTTTTATTNATESIGWLNSTLNSTQYIESTTIPMEWTKAQSTPLTREPVIDAYDREIFKRGRGTTISVSGILMTSLMVLLWDVLIQR